MPQGVCSSFCAHNGTAGAATDGHPFPQNMLLVLQKLLNLLGQVMLATFSPSASENWFSPPAEVKPPLPLRQGTLAHPCWQIFALSWAPLVIAGEVD